MNAVLEKALKDDLSKKILATVSKKSQETTLRTPRMKIQTKADYKARYDAFLKRDKWLKKSVQKATHLQSRKLNLVPVTELSQYLDINQNEILYGRSYSPFANRGINKS